MQLSPPVASVLSGGTTGSGTGSGSTSSSGFVGHVVTAAALGDGFSSIAIWLFQSFHLDPPAAVAQGVTAICMVIASVIMRKVSA